MTEAEAKKPRLDVENEGVNNGSGMPKNCIFMKKNAAFSIAFPPKSMTN